MKKPISITQYEQGVPFHSVYPDYDIACLPSWLRPRIDDARVYGSSKNMVILPDGSKYQLNNPLNDLSGGDWLKFTDSVFSTHYPTRGSESYAHEIRKIHPSPKPPQLMKMLIEFFTKENEGVLDFFMGVGGSLLGAALCNRNAVGIELNSEYIKAYKEAAKKLRLKCFPTFTGDSQKLLKDGAKLIAANNNSEFSFILIDPPYSNMMSKPKTGGDIAVYGAKASPFTDSPKDLGNMNHDKWLDTLAECIDLSLPLLRNKGYIAIFIKDLQPNKKDVNLLHAEIIYRLNSIDQLHYKGLKIWHDKSTKLFPYGYPLSFVANQTHQYILFFRKEI